MANELQLRVNDKMRTVTVPPETPLLYVLTDDLGLQGRRFGCGLGQCGCCSVLADGVEIRSCITPASRVVGKSLTTLEGLPAYYAMKMKLTKAPELHPLQEALIAEPNFRDAGWPSESDRVGPCRWMMRSRVSSTGSGVSSFNLASTMS